MSKSNPILAIVVPCYNEQEVLMYTTEKLITLLNRMIHQEKISSHSKIVYVNDGSQDTTWQIIQQLSDENDEITGINLSRNFGHQNALLAGLNTVRHSVDIAISIDADLQDDPETMIEMIEKYNQGNDIVYGVRSKRTTDTWFKRTTAEAYYKMMKLLGADIIHNHADYRLMSQRALNIFFEYPEHNMFIRGVVPLVGLQSAIVYYERAERFAGESKYPLKRMISFALDGITSFSIMPIRLVTYAGFLTAFIGILLLIYTIIVYLSGKTTHGWSSLMISIWVVGGIQLISLGIVGEYIGKIFKEVKNRPRYTIESENFKNKMNNQ